MDQPRTVIKYFYLFGIYKLLIMTFQSGSCALVWFSTDIIKQIFTYPRTLKLYYIQWHLTLRENWKTMLHKGKFIHHTVYAALLETSNTNNGYNFFYIIIKYVYPARFAWKSLKFCTNIIFLPQAGVTSKNSF